MLIQISIYSLLFSFAEDIIYTIIMCYVLSKWNESTTKYTLSAWRRNGCFMAKSDRLQSISLASEYCDGNELKKKKNNHGTKDKMRRYEEKKNRSFIESKIVQSGACWQHNSSQKRETKIHSLLLTKRNEVFSSCFCFNFWNCPSPFLFFYHKKNGLVL